METDAASPGWLEIWSCFPSLGHGQRWFVDLCTHEGKSTVADCGSAAEADAAAAARGLPVIYLQG